MRKKNFCYSIASIWQTECLHLGIDKRYILLLALLFLSACFSAKQNTYDDTCQLVSRSWTLETSKDMPKGLQIASNSCNSAECLLSFLVSGGAVSASTFVVSGSIVAVGNAIHWMERQGKCDYGSIQYAISSVQRMYGRIESTVITSKQQLLAFIADR